MSSISSARCVASALCTSSRTTWLTCVQEFLPREAKGLAAASDIMSPGTLIDILNGVMSNVADIVGADRLSKVLDVGDAVTNVIQASSVPSSDARNSSMLYRESIPSQTLW